MAKMKAAVLHGVGDLRVEAVEVPQLKNADDVLVHVHAVGICGSDLDRVMVTGTYNFPTIPGHEFCGEVAQVGSGVKNYTAGDRVLVTPILPCMVCESCVKGNYGQCSNYSYLGSRTDGGMAEYVVAPAKNLIPLPDSISYTEGAAVEPAAVTLHGMLRIKVDAGDSVVVLGCGTIGLFAIQFAKIMGATQIIAVDIDAEKLNWAKAAGADILVNGKQTDPVAEVQRITGIGANVVIETAGTAITQEQSIRACKKHGRILYLGTAHRDVVLPPETFEHIVRNEIWLTGSWNSYSAPFPGVEWKAVLSYIQKGRLNVKDSVTHTYPLAEAAKVIADLFGRKYTFNKVVLEI